MNSWQILHQYPTAPDDIPVLSETDILVVGGGAAGVAAAVTASEMGLKTTLVEGYGFCGGSAVAGLSGTICGLYLASENEGNSPQQVVFGFSEKFKKAMKPKAD